MTAKQKQSLHDNVRIIIRRFFRDAELKWSWHKTNIRPRDYQYLSRTYRQQLFCAFEGNVTYLRLRKDHYIEPPKNKKRITALNEVLIESKPIRLMIG